MTTTPGDFQAAHVQSAEVQPAECSLTATAWPVLAVRAAEERLLARSPDGALMARAAHGLAHHCAALLAEHERRLYGIRVVILAGRGSNGGDALHAGALLARRGAAVTAVLAVAQAGEVEPDLTALRGAVHQPGLAALRDAGGRMICSDGDTRLPLLVDASLIVDGLVGIGGRGALRSPAAGLARYSRAARERGALVVAADLPSGVDADTGEIASPDSAVAADLTVTFGCLKPGLLLAPGAHHAGRLRVVDIGLSRALAEGIGKGMAPVLRATSDADVAAAWPKSQVETDKYDRGVLGIAAGSTTYPGAAQLAAGGALAGPIGMLRYVGEAAHGVVERYPEAVPGRDVATAGRVQAWVVGPGLGTDERAAQTLQAVLDAGLPTVVDGDAITLLARSLTRGGKDQPGKAAASEAEQPLLARYGASVVLTPHRREFARLMDACSLSAAEQDTSLAIASRVATRLGATLLLKGSRTLIVTPGRLNSVNLTGTPVLATAGSGDVLAGLLGALLASGMRAHEAAAVAAHLHGLAGRTAATIGTVTPLALLGVLPAVVSRLTSGVTLEPHMVQT